MISLKDKRGLEMAISTIIILVLAVLVLAGLISILVMGWDNFKDNIGTILGSETSQARKDCQVQCNLDNSYDYCCQEKVMGDSSLKCGDEILKGDCILDCSSVICE